MSEHAYSTRNNSVFLGPVYTHNNPVAVSTDVPISSHLILTLRKNSAAAMRRQFVVKVKISHYKPDVPLEVPGG